MYAVTSKGSNELSDPGKEEAGQLPGTLVPELSPTIHPVPSPGSYKPTTDEEKRLDRWIDLKLDICVALSLSVGMMLLTMDKIGLGFVATSTFIKDAALSEDAVSLGLTLFSTTYVPMHPVSTTMSLIVGPKNWVIGLLFCCGVLSMCHAAIRSDGSLIALRLLLGCAEAGYNPCCVYIFSLHYTRRSLALRMGIFTASFTIAGVLGGFVAYGLLSIDDALLRGWQILYLSEGSFTLLVAVAVFILGPRTISTAWFLTKEQREHAVRRIQIDQAGHSKVDSQGRPVPETDRVTWQDVKDVITDFKKMSIILFGICVITPMNAFPTFLPLLIEGMGYQGHDAALMCVSPFAVGIIVLLLVMYCSDKLRDRSGPLIISLVPALCSIVVLVVVDNNAARYAAMHGALTGVLSAGSLISVWLANNTPGKGARSFVLGLNGVTHIGGVIAGQLFKVKYAPKYEYPLTVVAILLAVAIVGFGVLRLLYMRENNIRDRKTANWGPKEYEEEKLSSRRGDQLLSFRNTL